MNGAWSRISLIFLFLVGCVGTVLRSTPYFGVPFQYMNLVHAHSHVAFQGWIYTVMFLFLIDSFLTKKQIQNGRYPLQLKLTILVVSGVLISFSLQGYGWYSIVFSTLFQVLNYWFIYRFFKDSDHLYSGKKRPLPLRLVRTGLTYGLISTLLPIGIGLLSSKGLSDSEAYQSLVYTFLHLQYNGWFLLVVLGLFYQNLKDRKIPFDVKKAAMSFKLLSISVIPSISLSLLGMSFSNFLTGIAYVSAALLATGIFYFYRSLPLKRLLSWGNENFWFNLFLKAFLLSFFLKSTLQCLSALELWRDYAFHNRFVIIAYLHLSLIGTLSFFFIALIIYKKWQKPGAWLNLGSSLLILGFLATELVLASTGVGLYYSGEILLVGSAAMTLGVLFLTLSSKTNS